MEDWQKEILEHLSIEDVKKEVIELYNELYIGTTTGTLIKRRARKTNSSCM